jgi:thymidylate synthase
MKQYLEALQYILDNGTPVSDRTGIGTRSVFGYQMRFNLQEGFPAVTTKRLAWKAVVGELLWFLEGSTDERRLAEITYGADRTELVDKNTIWTANANKQGVDLGYINTDCAKGLGPVYGYQWRNFNKANGSLPGNLLGTDQIEWLINEIKTNPDSRRIILTAWNPNQLSYMALPPCHTLAQFRVYNRKLFCQLYQRSCDMFLGVPFNISSYALLTHIIAKICGLGVGDFVWTGGDCHIYENHIEQVKEQVSRQPQQLPHLLLPVFCDLETLLHCKVSDFSLVNYNPMPNIKAPMAV